MMQMISNEFVCRVDEAFNFLGDLWHDERIKKPMVFYFVFCMDDQNIRKVNFVITLILSSKVFKYTNESR